MMYERSKEVIKLESFKKSDFKQLINWINSEEFLIQWSGNAFTFPLDEQQLEKYIESANTLAFKVVDEETSDVIGHISLGQIDNINKSARIGKVLVGNTKMRGRSIGKHMMKAVLHIAFDELKLHRVTLGVYDFNTSAISCYEKIGFVKEGLLRESKRVGETYWNLWEMSMLEYEWKK
ncbi:GNAT family protein [Bacillus tropicus]|jgi:RimJ/RimL family protein N-acetyltransferase|uniref:Aminoglycoside adenylyltransferase n=11 Tax=Bacillus TaxID=1386 RepID=A0A9X8SQQ6_BACCE|nr:MULTISPECIES: GNAT family protein [Bacillus]ANN32510.1 aminoglycoside adenylyltransferase [Bacillus thuringiensis serovar coreanensis]MBJ6719312.1 GNAT family N-acetyltransferase [Bacillus sp. PR5]MCO4216262.1 GNAT family N-acetyltransferase [Bacillus sp. 10017]MCU7389817.1 GNAT family N-acetyltransferase [Bacillus sp. ST24]MDL2418164.1 GNAT family protein [Bacillus shihchuchen]MDV8109862.1 GNAT family protein [Bacillus sp. BAU-SS-2023]MEB4844306.1 GNAT family protein [Paenibacillus jamil